jgi:hypothetical protein
MIKPRKTSPWRMTWALAATSVGMAQNAAPAPTMPPPAVAPPPPAVAAPPPAAGDTIQLPPYEVIGEKPQWGAFHQSFETLNHAFDGPFPELRSGPLIEAILWRHRYLITHPSDDAIILTILDGQRIKAATTIYTKDGQLFASSNALGENRRLQGFAAADLHRPASIERVKAVIQFIRDHYLPGGDETHADEVAAADDSANADLNGGLPTLGKALILAEEQGDYSSLAAMAGGQGRGQRGAAHAALVDAMLMSFYEASPEVLSWTYQALHDVGRSGMVPVALSQVEVGTTAGAKDTFQALVFDWDGMHCIYHPDRGTFETPLPKNPVTDRPYLCVRNGGLLEDVYFCASYLKDHPQEKAVIVPGDPSAVAYTVKGTVGIFGLSRSSFGLPKRFGADLLANAPTLAQIRDVLMLQVTKMRADPKSAVAVAPIPPEMMGDDADLQLRRAFLAFQDVGVVTHLKEGANLSLDFTWHGATYVYGADQQVHSSTTP